MKRHHLALIVCFSLSIGIVCFPIAQCGLDMDCWRLCSANKILGVALGFVVLGVMIGVIGEIYDTIQTQLHGAE